MERVIRKSSIPRGGTADRLTGTVGAGPYALPMRRSVLGIVATVVAVAMSVMSSLFVFGADGYDATTRTLHPTALSSLSLVAAIGAAVMLCWRHRWPLLVTAIAVVPPLLMRAEALAALIALAALAANRRDKVLWAAGTVVFVATGFAIWRDAGRGPGSTIAGQLMGTDTMAGKVIGVVVLTAVVVAIPLTVGIMRGVRLDLARRDRKERELRDEMTRQEERSRIAHEMHDVLGHRLSLLSLQAGALEVNSSPKAGEVARTVRTTARQSLEDLRQVIGVLRDGREFATPEASASPERAQPTLVDLPELVANTRRAGLPVNLTVLLDQAGTAPAPLGTAVYRIVQESLTNVLRHAPGTGADVTVRGGPGVGLTLEVVNPLPAAAPVEPSPGGGTGLTGIAERVGVLGGNVSIGPTAERVFAVRAWLPWVPH
jgi:signal transduction histidine kinase